MCPRPRTCPRIYAFQIQHRQPASQPFPEQRQSWRPTRTPGSGQGSSTKGAFSAGGGVSHSSGNRYSLGNKQALPLQPPTLLPWPRGWARLLQESLSGLQPHSLPQACLPAARLGEDHCAPQICAQSPQNLLGGNWDYFLPNKPTCSTSPEQLLPEPPGLVMGAKAPKALERRVLEPAADMRQSR